VGDIDVIKAVKTMAFFPEQRFILSNAYIGELKEVWNSLENVWVDLSSLEQWVNLSSMEHKDFFQMLKQNDFIGRTLFATHTPFYFPEGALYKLKYTDASSEDIEHVAWRNAEKLLAW
jgi:predicted TIM-barrel fold metal-dependent hydrolase